MIALILAAALAQIGPGPTLDVVVGVGGGGGGPNTLVLSAPFETPGAYTSPVAIPRGGPVTVTRMGSRTCIVGGVMITLSTNQACIEVGGLSVEPSGINYVLQSVDLSLIPWGTGGVLTVTPPPVAGCVGPTGAQDMALIDNTAGAGGGRYQIITLATQALSNSVWASPQGVGTTSLSVEAEASAGSIPVDICICTVRCIDGTTAACTPTTYTGNYCVVYASALTKLCRVTASSHLTSPTTSVVIAASPGYELPPSVTTDKACVGYAQVETSMFPTSTTVTTGTPAQHLTETDTVVAPGVVGGSAGSFPFLVTPEWSSATAGSDRVIWSTAGVVLTWLNSSSAFSVTAGGATATSSTLIFAANTAHIVKFRYGGVPGMGACISVDGTENCGGTFTSFTPSGLVYIGGDASGGAGVAIKDLSGCTANGTCP